MSPIKHAERNRLRLAGILGVLGMTLDVVAFRETHYPRWFAVANPLVVQGVTGAIALVAPLELRVVLVVTVYNLSLLVFYALSTVLLWNGRRHDARSLRNEAT